MRHRIRPPLAAGATEEDPCCIRRKSAAPGTGLSRGWCPWAQTMMRNKNIPYTLKGQRNIRIIPWVPYVRAQGDGVSNTKAGLRVSLQAAGALLTTVMLKRPTHGTTQPIPR